MKGICMKKLRKYKYRGFTIIEMIVVISIISILSAITIPLYKNYIDKAKRVKAISIGQSICCAALWSYKNQKSEVNPARIKADVEDITAYPIQQVTVNKTSNTLELYFSSNNENYVAELDTDINSHIIRERFKGTIIHE